MISFDEMPGDNADLASLDVSFPRLSGDSAASCPVPVEDLVEYLRLEGEDGSAHGLEFVRTTSVDEVEYWLWRFEADDGFECYGERRLSCVPCDGDVMPTA